MSNLKMHYQTVCCTYLNVYICFRGIVYIDGYADSSEEAIAKGYCFSFRTYKNETGGVADMYGKCSDELHHSFVVVRQ